MFVAFFSRPAKRTKLCGMQYIQCFKNISIRTYTFYLIQFNKISFVEMCKNMLTTGVQEKNVTKLKRAAKIEDNISLIVRKPVFGVSDQV